MFKKIYGNELNEICENELNIWKCFKIKCMEMNEVNIWNSVLCSYPYLYSTIQLKLFEEK